MKSISTNKLSLCILGLVIFIGLSCKKSNSSPTLSAAATIVDEGDADADGCGWLVKINSTDSLYQAPGLAAQYKINGLAVQITYQKLSTKFYCGSVPEVLHSGITEITLTTIKSNDQQ